jgi:hypothetical protein
LHVDKPQFLLSRPLVLLQRVKLAGSYLIGVKACLCSVECTHVFDERTGRGQRNFDRLSGMAAR